MELESLDDFKTHLSESIKRREKAIDAQEKRLAGLDSELRSARHAEETAQSQSEEARQRYIDAQRYKERCSEAVRSFEREQANIPAAIKQDKDQNDSDLNKLSRLEERSKVIQATVGLEGWRQRFDWEFISEANDPSFYELVKQLESLARVMIELREACTDHQRLFDAATVAQGDTKRMVAMQELAKAGHRRATAEGQLSFAISAVIGAQLADLKTQLKGLPNLPPAAHDEAHNTITVSRIKLTQKFEERRRLLEKAWPGPPS